jgi:hypothetical protein
MREIRQSGSEGGGLKPMSSPYPYCESKKNGEATAISEDSDTVARNPKKLK